MLQILLDGGNTHEFIDLDIAKKVVCKLKEISPLTFTTTRVYYYCDCSSLGLLQPNFRSSVVDILGSILWDFDKLQMVFSTQGDMFILCGAKVLSTKLNKVMS